VNYGALYKATLKNKYPYSQIDDILDQIHGVRKLNEIDLRSDHHQI
jgi:hypothetical protein